MLETKTFLRKERIKVEAVHYDGTNGDEVIQWLFNRGCYARLDNKNLLMDTPFSQTGTKILLPGYFAVEHNFGFSGMREDQFLEEYEEIIEWKDIPGFPWYELHRDGEIRLKESKEVIGEAAYKKTTDGRWEVLLTRDCENECGSEIVPVNFLAMAMRVWNPGYVVERSI